MISETLVSLGSAQKPAQGVSAYSVWVNRPAGRFVAAVAYHLGLTPNAVSVLSGLASLFGIALLIVLPPRPVVAILAAGALAFGFVFDAADGQLARLSRQGSRAGEWLDHVIDCAVKLALHAAVLVAWYRLGAEGALLLVPLAYQFLTVVMFFGGTLAGIFLVAGPGLPVGSTGPAWQSRLALLPVDHGVLCWSFLLWPWQSLFATWYGALAAAQAVCLVTLLVHWWHQLRAAPA